MQPVFPAAPAREDGRWFSPRRHRSKAHTLLFFHFQTDIHKHHFPSFPAMFRLPLHFLPEIPVQWLPYSSLPDKSHTAPHPPESPGKMLLISPGNLRVPDAEILSTPASSCLPAQIPVRTGAARSSLCHCSAVSDRAQYCKQKDCLL